MYKQNFKRRPFRKGPPSGNGRRFHAGHRIKSQGIDISKFVNRAVENEVSAPFVPEHLFKDFNIREELKKNILAKGYESPTPIQDKIIPHILNGSDVVGIANTGTGKTGAFLIPLINKVLMSHKENVLIVAPTRELAIQINQELKDFSRYLKIFSVCCVGGAHIGRQISELKRPHRFIIGTPGRIKDLNKRKLIDFSRFNTIVLDEADRMLDMGFIEDMRFMMSRLPKERHTLFFSATLSKDIEKLIAEFLNKPITVSVKTRDTASSVDQDIIRLKHGEDKIEVLHNLLTKPEFNKVLIFGKTKHGVEKLYATLAKRGLRVESIHGDKNHSKRQRALGLFKDNHAKILVATDVAARGLDIDGISHVINFDIPATYEDYVHRIGRTGRGNKKGKALTFVN
ncbi:MAG: ATP-dependent helicase [Parcubacteria group bacterium CG10_big_fil_rev_8_21_14_0_10_38_31]|nr:MAG: ATP-dependent helicase [Parcubacteria group bacterium CG10_big_fil_rev_8_21_14_0_10_38_31]